MKIKIENGKLGQAMSLFFDLSLKGKQSRHRTRFIKLLNDRLKEVAEQEKELLKEHCNLDDEGEPKKIKNDTEWDVIDKDAFKKDMKELHEEELIIEGGDAQGMLKTVKTVVLDCDKEFSGQEAYTYDYLCEQFEIDEEESK
ncbi:DUF1617 family protein [Virgibacillus litoralis]|uniref:DUF1617 family protein n=1 Tax=Virgibacillus litoralis TaxID=578221 RepID=A0ABS4HH98_9BACI|nr:DUF1617 family protein [Virgibacillus litoralis]MBP1950304.1 hypothetical protein [Virgibacillus litoralis]